LQTTASKEEVNQETAVNFRESQKPTKETKCWVVESFWVAVTNQPAAKFAGWGAASAFVLFVAFCKIQPPFSGWIAEQSGRWDTRSLFGGGHEKAQKARKDAAFEHYVPFCGYLSRHSMKILLS
jgi:hypothetical protein